MYATEPRVSHLSCCFAPARSALIKLISETDFYRRTAEINGQIACGLAKRLTGFRLIYSEHYTSNFCFSIALAVFSIKVQFRSGVRAKWIFR